MKYKVELRLAIHQEPLLVIKDLDREESELTIGEWTQAWFAGGEGRSFQVLDGGYNLDGFRRYGLIETASPGGITIAAYIIRYEQIDPKQRYINSWLPELEERFGFSEAERSVEDTVTYLQVTYPPHTVPGFVGTFRAPQISLTVYCYEEPLRLEAYIQILDYEGEDIYGSYLYHKDDEEEGWTI